MDADTANADTALVPSATNATGVMCVAMGSAVTRVATAPRVPATVRGQGRAADLRGEGRDSCPCGVGPGWWWLPGGVATEPL